MYGKLTNNKLEYAPINYITDEGRMIFNFNKNIDIMKKYGFKEIINTIPEYDINTKEIIRDGFTETENNISINYTIIDKIENPLNTEEQLELLKKQNIELINQINTMQEVLDFMLFDINLK